MSKTPLADVQRRNTADVATVRAFLKAMSGSCFTGAIAAVKAFDMLHPDPVAARRADVAAVQDYLEGMGSGNARKALEAFKRLHADE